jgi:hypothetical protein
MQEADDFEKWRWQRPGENEEAGALGLVVCLATKIVGHAEFAQRPN